jgi:hypothetical protein
MILTAVAISLLACSASPPETGPMQLSRSPIATRPPSQPNPSATESSALVVLNAGFSASSQASVFSYTFVASNTAEDSAFEDNPFTVSFFDEAGNLLKEDKGLLEAILPKEVTAKTSRVTLMQPPARIEVALLSGRRRNLVEMEAIRFLDGGLGLSCDEPFTAHTELTNPYGIDLQNLRVTTILYNEVGEIIDGREDKILELGAAETKSLEIELAGACNLAPAKATIYVGLSKLPLPVTAPQTRFAN